jgi:putative ABC transport system substrate-binding protein
MRRRQFITLLGGAATAWPLAARAQQAGRVRRVGVLRGAEATDPEAQRQHAVFRQELQKLGWTEDRNVQFEYRWSWPRSRPDSDRRS